MVEDVEEVEKKVHILIFGEGAFCSRHPTLALAPTILYSRLFWRSNLIGLQQLVDGNINNSSCSMN